MDSFLDIFLQFFQGFSEKLLYRTSLIGCFCIVSKQTLTLTLSLSYFFLAQFARNKDFANFDEKFGFIASLHEKLMLVLRKQFVLSTLQ